MLQVITVIVHFHFGRAYSNGTVVVSDTTIASFPVGVDFYKIGAREKQHGPFGVLHPQQYPPGSGLFRCVDNMTGDGFANFYDFPQCQ